MDPADFDRVKEAVGNQGQLLSSHQQLLQTLVDEVKKLSTQLANLPHAAPMELPQPEPLAAELPTAPVFPAAEPHIPPPAKYSGDPNTCREFLTQVRLTFNAQPSRFRHEAAKIAFIASLLEGPPLSYFNALDEQASPAAQSFDLFAAELKRIYDHPIRGQQAGQQLLILTQGRRSVREYASEFRSLAVESGWNDQALLTAFQSGLNRAVGREIALREEHHSLDAAITAAIKISDQLSQWQVEPFPPRSSAPPAGENRGLLPGEPRRPVSQAMSSGSHGEEPMQVGRTRLTPDERQMRMKSGACLYCGQFGHFLASCPLRPKGQAHQ